jgi:hypothetical protein
MINSNQSSIDEENIPFGIHPSKDHSHSLAPCAPAFLVGATGHRRRVPKKEGQQHLYSPPLGHLLRPRPPSGHSRSPSGHSRSPSGTHAPSIGHLSPSVGRPSTVRWAPVRVSICPTRPLGIAGHPRRSVRPLRQAHRPTVCINILAYHDYVYIFFLWRSTWPKILNI